MKAPKQYLSEATYQNLRSFLEFLKIYFNFSNYQIINKITNYEKLEIQFMRHCFKRAQIGVVYDIGANRGQFGRRVLASNFQGDLHSFEPLPGPFELLKKKSKKCPRWVVHNLAIDTSSGEREINVSQNDEFSSFLELCAGIENEFSTSKVAHKVNIKTISFEDFLQQNQKLENKCGYLKLDTQGYDLEILRTIDLFAANISVVQIELSLRKIYEESPRYLEVIKYLDQKGYTITYIGHNNSGTKNQLYEVDAIFELRE